MLSLVCDPVSDVGLRYVGFMSKFFPSCAESASLNTGTREILSLSTEYLRGRKFLRLAWAKTYDLSFCDITVTFSLRWSMIYAIRCFRSWASRN